MSDSHTLQWQSLSAGYGKQQVLHDICATIETGNLLAIVGPNGCGKSTLLKATLGLLPPLSGKVLLNGKPTSAYRREELARHMAYLPQGRSTPDMTVEQLVLHGRFPHVGYPRRYSEKDRAIAREAMAQTGLLSLAATPLSSLSGGMRQNAYIAMALTQQTEYILLDEPTTYLDIDHALALMKRLRALSEAGRGIIAVLHDLPLAMSFAHQVAVMNEGRLLLLDTPEVVSSSGYPEQILGVSLYRPEGSSLYAYREPQRDTSILERS